MVAVTPFDLVGHLVRVPVEMADGSSGRFLLDSGIGVSVVAPSAVERLGLVGTGESITGRRMSGQEVHAPLVRLGHLTVGGHSIREAVAGVADLGPSGGPDGFDGILGLDLFDDVLVSVDHSARVVRIGGQDHGCGPQARQVPVRVHRDGLIVSLFATLRLPSGRRVEVEVDTGSDCLILDTRFMADCGVEARDCDTRTGTDETGVTYLRRFADIAGPVELAGSPPTQHREPRVMFQDIIYDGLLGAAFLSRSTYCFDVAASRLVLASFTK